MAYWAMMLTLTGMYTMYVINLGFSKAEVSLAVIIYTFSSLLGQNFIGFLADRFRRVKLILMLSISMGVFTVLGLLLARENWQVLLSLAVWGFFVYGTTPLMEAWVIGYFKSAGQPEKFGVVRGMGSVGYGTTGVIVGLLLHSFGWKIYHWCIITGIVLALTALMSIKDIKEETILRSVGKAPEAAGKLSFGEVFRKTVSIKPLRSLILIIVMYNFVIKGVYNYLGVLISDFGGGPLSLGLTYLCDATPEVVTFFLTSRLMRRFHSKWFILAAFVLQIIRLSLILVFNSSLAITLLGVLSGFAYGLIATAYKTYIYELAPEKYKISCLSLSESIIGISGVMSVPVFGFIIIKLGGPAAIATGLALDIIAMLVILKDILKARQAGNISNKLSA